MIKLGMVSVTDGFCGITHWEAEIIQKSTVWAVPKYYGTALFMLRLKRKEYDYGKVTF